MNDVLKVFLPREAWVVFLSISLVYFLGALALALSALLQAALQGAFQSIPADLGMVFGGSGLSFMGVPVTEEVVDKIKAVPGVVRAGLGVFWRTNVSACGRNSLVLVNAVDREVVPIFDYLGPEEGHLPQKGEALLGGALARFFKCVKPGRRIKVGEKTLKVAGIGKEMGGLFSSDDQSLFVLREDFPEVEGLTYALFEFRGEDTPQAVEKILGEDYTVLTARDFLEKLGELSALLNQVGEGLSLFSALLALIASVAVSFATFSERREEIKILRFLGLSQSETWKMVAVSIAFLTLVPAVLPSLLGGWKVLISGLLSFVLSMAIFKVFFGHLLEV